MRSTTTPTSDTPSSGFALDRAANQDFVEQVRMRIFEPMGMTSSTYLIDANLQARLATGYYNRPGQPVNTEYPLRQHANSGYRVPGGGVYSTVDDLARLAAGVMGRGGRELFSHAARSEMLSVQTPNGGRTGAGFGIFLRAVGDRIFASHGGTAAGYKAYLIFEPATGADRSPASQLQLGADGPERDRPLAHLQLARGLRIPDSGPMTASLIPGKAPRTRCP